MPLLVGLDGRAFASPAAGVRRYLEGLAPALLALENPPRLAALGGDAAPPGIVRVAEPLHPPTNFGWSVVGLPRAARRAGVDVIHAPAYTGPFWAPVPVVLTIHDVSYERHPEWYPYRRDRLRRAFYRRSARAAAHILTDSEFSAREIGEAYDISRDRLTVAPLGVDPNFAPPGLHQPGTVPSPPYLLHVGDLHVRRNLAMVVDAVIRARARSGVKTLSLVLAGVDRGVGELLDALASARGASDVVARLGLVDDRHLRGLYGGAAALVYPSRYEGFGLPVLEAMACGTPVIASRAGSIPEVLGDAGTLLEPDDVEGWTEAIAAVVGDAGVSARMRAQGLARAAAFTWARTAAITADVYRRAAERG